MDWSAETGHQWWWLATACYLPLAGQRYRLRLKSGTCFSSRKVLLLWLAQISDSSFLKLATCPCLPCSSTVLTEVVTCGSTSWSLQHTCAIRRDEMTGDDTGWKRRKSYLIILNQRLCFRHIGAWAISAQEALGYLFIHELKSSVLKRFSPFAGQPSLYILEHFRRHL